MSEPRFRIRFIENIFERDRAEVFEPEYKYQALGEWFDQLVGRERDGFYPILSGRRAEWDEIPGLEDDVIFICEVKGPIAGAIAAIWGAISAFMIAHPILAMVIGTLVSSLLGMAMSFLFAPEVPKDSFANSQTYQWDGIKNGIGEGNALPVVYGEHRVGGAVIEAWIDGEKAAGATKASYLNVLLALSEGPIQDVNLNSIKLNKQDIGQFKEVTSYKRLGHNNQNPIKGFNRIVRHFNITGVQLKYNQPWIYSLDGDTLDAATVNISAPGLFNTDNDEGHMNGLAIDFNVEFAPYGSSNSDPEAWTTVDGNATITGTRTVWKWVFVPQLDPYTGQPMYDPYTGEPLGTTEKRQVTETYTYKGWRMSAKSKSAVNLSVPIGFPYSGKWKIRITRTTQNFASIRYVGDTYVNQVKEVELGRIAYVNTALLAIRLKATERLSGMMPTITVMIKGRVLRDVRSGELSWAHSKNPANIIYDLLTHRRYGLGNVFGFSQAQIDSIDGVSEFIDVDSLRAFANYCDELVSYKYYDPNHADADEKGWVTAEAERRYEINCVLDTKSRAMDLLAKLCGSCRALPYWAGSKFKLVIERESQPVQMFNMANIVYDSYSEDYVSIHDIPNVMECYLLDEKDDYERVAITGMDKRRWQDPTRVKEVNLYGLTSIARAKRELAFAMAKAKSIKKFITFQAGMDSIVCEAGDVFMFQHDVPKYGLAGGQVKTITQGGADHWFIEIDRSVNLVGGTEYCLRIRRNANNIQKVYWFTAPRTEKTKILELPAYSDLGFVVGDLYAVGEGLNIAFGRISAIDAALNRVTIDASVTMKAGRQYSLRVQMVDGTIKVHTFTADADYTGSVLQINPGEVISFSVNDLYAFGFVSKEAVPFRLTSLVRKDDKKAEITAEQYISSVFSDDHTIRVVRPRRKALGQIAMLAADTEEGMLEEPDVAPLTEESEFTGSQKEMPPLVTDVQLTEEVALVGDVYSPSIVVSFGEVEMPDNAIAKINRYEIHYSKDAGGTWHRDGTCSQGPYRIRGVEAGATYHVLVKPRTNYNVTNNHEDKEGALDFSITPTGDLPADTAVASPSGLICNSTPFANELRWTESECPTLKAYEIWCAVNQNDRSAAVKVAITRGTTYSHGNLDPDDDYFYWIRAVNKKNKPSAYHPGDTAGGRGKLLDFDGGTF
jgi:predicted phage tail protein